MRTVTPTHSIYLLASPSKSSRKTQLKASAESRKHPSTKCPSPQSNFQKRRQKVKPDSPVGNSDACIFRPIPKPKRKCSPQLPRQVCLFTKPSTFAGKPLCLRAKTISRVVLARGLVAVAVNTKHLISIRQRIRSSRLTKRISTTISGMTANQTLVHGWKSTDCGRGTSDILWSCLSTILLCVWTVIHLPLPCCSVFEDGQPIQGEPSQSRRNWIIRNGILPAVLSVIAPEFLTFTAIKERINAWKHRKRMTEMKWTLTHTFFLQMGGFCLETPSGKRLQLDATELQSAIDAGKGIGNRSPDWLQKLKEVEDFQINDHATSSPLTKFIACSQALWLVTQVITRVCRHQAVTLLEVSTLAYAACALIAYVAWWKKPQNATLPIMIPCSDEDFPKRSIEDPLYYSDVDFYEYLWAGQHWGRHLSGGDDAELIDACLMSLCPAIFGAIHVASWNIRLVSNVEQWLWRASALYCCTAGLLIFLMGYIPYICVRLSWIGEATAEMVSSRTLLVIIWLYVLVRLFMIVEAFASLRELPPSAYESVHWSSFIPHTT